MNTLQRGLLALSLLGFAGAAQGAGKLGVMDAWLRAAPANEDVAAYATLSNHGDARLRILTVQADDFRMTSLHDTVLEGRVEKMRKVSHLNIDPGQTVRLEPGGLHLMLMHPRVPVAAGDVVEVIFLLDDGTRVPTHFDVRPMQAD